MQDDEAYLKDFGLSSPQFMFLDKINEEAQNIAKNLATSNTEKKNEIEALLESNSELQSEFESKQAELKDLLEQY